MSYTHYIRETLKEYDGDLYKMIEIRIVRADSKFAHRALPISLIVTDGPHTVNSFISTISGNQKELITFFTVDAFTGFSNNSTIKFGYGGQYTDVITNVDVQNVTPLPSLLVGVPHQMANNAWLQGLN